MYEKEKREPAMRTFLSGRGTFGRLVARLIVWTLITGQVMMPAYAATTALADVPIAAKVTAKPNIVYTLDDSGSMQNNFLPDYVTNVGATIVITITSTGTTATASGSVNALAVGDFVNIVGAAQAAYNGYVQITAKPTATTFKYTMPTTASSPATIAAGYGNIQVVTSSAYCRNGNNTTPCTAQAQNIGSTVVTLTSVTRPASGLAGGTTATATAPAASLAAVNTGDTLLIQGGTTTSIPYNGSYVVTKTSSTTFTYDITPTSTTPAIMSPVRQFVLVGASFAAPPLHTADFNRLAYNPEVTYLPPILDTGLPMTTAATDANGNYGTTSALFNSASVARDPFYAYEATKMWAGDPKDNLGLKVLVPLYCNTDWPALVNDVYWPGGPNGATVLDAGDSNGQYSAGTGGWCRINGTKYDASVASTAPAIQDDYNYPYNSSSGATGAQYFFRAVGTKTLWCDKTSPYYPRNTTIASCTGGTPVYTAPVPQTCVTQALICGTGSSKTYNPAACNPATSGWLAGEWCAGGQAAGATGTLPECKSCGCVSDTAPSPARKCSLSGLACVTNSDCPDFSNTIASCSGGIPVYTKAPTPACTGSPLGVMWDPVANAPGTTTLLADSNGAGVVCRHNNFAYAVGAVVPGVATYPRTNVNDVDPVNKPGQLGQFTTGATSGCPPVGTTVAIPRHYYVVDSVQFCDDRIVTADAQWKGFGTGVCKTNNDLARFKEVKYGKFTRIDLFASNAKAFPGTTNLAAQTTPYPTGRAWLASAPAGPDNSESINYANWYAYYSTRLLAAKTTSSIAFSYLTPGPGETEQYRVGFHNLGDEPTGYGGGSATVIFVNVDDWKPAQRTSWYNALFGISIPIGVGGFQTPTIDAMIRIGSLFEKGDNSGVPAEVNPLPGSASDPIPTISGKQISCQNNFHILFTDGKTNQVSLPTAIGDQDETIPSGANSIVTITPTTNLPILQAGGTWPAPFKQGSPAVGNTLSDVATRYWAYDLRPTLKNDVPAAKGTLELDPTKDVAWWQHVSFSAISFGAQGTLDATDVKTTVGLIKAGTLSWPNLTNPNNPVYPRGAGAGAVAVDDLWHATVNSRGSFVYANTPVEVAYGLANILAGIQNQQKSRAAAAFGGQVLDSTNNIIYEATIEPGWAGDLLKVEINPSTGAEVKTWWQASIELAKQILAPTPLVDEPWMDETKRRIVTINSSTGTPVPFRFANLSSAQLVSLAKTATQQQKVIAYLRGGNTYGGQFIEGTGIGQFRQRSGPLGDISNAQAVIVPPTATYDALASPPGWVLTRPYDDATDPGYSTYVTANRTRATRIVAASNDGMVHVFDAGPVNPVAAGGGQEIFAYIPKALFRGTAGAKATEDTTAIQALTYQDGGVPIYKHHMYVDSTPRVADVDFGNGTGDWHTIVVGGLGKGGNSYYALDVSDPDAATEAAAAAKVVWEWTDPSNDLKYTYGKPVIVKTRAYGWVVIVTSGYNNVSGVGKLYFLRASDGTLLKTMSTGVGTPTNPSGFAQIHAFVADYRNQIAEQVYGGDLLGNMWRFDVHDANAANWTVDLLAKFKDLDSGLPQPVTTAPQIEIDINNGIDRYVFIGTGQLLDTSDFTTTPQRQTFYAIRDGTLASPLTSGLPIDPRVTMKAVNSDKVSSIVGGAPNGWFDDLPLTPTAERIVVDVQADVNIAAYVGTQAQNDPCVISLPATLYARDFTTAKSLLLSSGTTVPGIAISQGAIGTTIVGRRDSSGNQSLGILVSTEIPGTKPFDVQNPVTGPGQRLSWRLLTGE